MIKSIGNKLETLKFLSTIKELKLPAPEQEHRIYIRGHIKGEKPHRIDFSWPSILFAIEIEGGVFSYGAHVRGSHYIHDMKKYNWLSKNGWTLLRYTWQNIDYDEIKSVYDMLIKTKKKIENI